MFYMLSTPKDVNCVNTKKYNELTYLDYHICYFLDIKYTNSPISLENNINNPKIYSFCHKV